MPFKFEQLTTWKLALEYSENVNFVTKTFPSDELYSLTSQFKRAADSISLNIAEGSTGQSDKEQHKFLGYAIRSLMECVNCIHLSQRRKYIDQATFDQLYKAAETLFVKLCRFRNSMEAKNGN